MNSTNNNEPIILGELKKEKSSKPFFVFLVFALILGTCFGLPYIQDYLVNGEGPIVDFYNKITGNEVATINNNANTSNTITVSINDNSLFLLKSDTILNIDNIYIQDIIISKGSISYRIMARESINLDEMSYYLEVYNNNRALLDKIKLTGSISSASINKTNATNFDTSNEYYVKLIKNENN